MKILLKFGIFKIDNENSNNSLKKMKITIMISIKSSYIKSFLQTTQQYLYKLNSLKSKYGSWYLQKIPNNIY